MEKVIYFKKQVKLGDLVQLDGAKVPVTQELIDNNPELFEVKQQEDKKFPEYAKCINGSFGIALGDIVKTKYYPHSGYPYRSCVPKSTTTTDGYMSLDGFLKNFEPATEQDYLMFEANRRYKKGDIVKGFTGNRIELHEVGSIYLAKGCILPSSYGASVKTGQSRYVCLYLDGKWAGKV